MRDGTTLNLAIGPLLLAAEEDGGTAWGGEKSPENSWDIFSHQTPCVHFGLIQKRELVLGSYSEIGTSIRMLWLQIMFQIKGGRHSSMYSWHSPLGQRTA